MADIRVIKSIKLEQLVADTDVFEGFFDGKNVDGGLIHMKPLKINPDGTVEVEFLAEGVEDDDY